MSLERIRTALFLTPISTILWLSTIGVSILLVYYFNLPLPWLLVPIIAYVILFLHEVLAFFVFYTGIFPSKERIARVYEWMDIFRGIDETTDFQKIGDLTEGYFGGNYDKSLTRAVTDKYDEIIKMLSLKKGHCILDVGCGLGDFLVYLKQHGIEGVGLTLSPDQQRIAKSRGLDVRIFDFRDKLSSEFIGKFDAVVLIGSLEHFVQSYTKRNQPLAMKTWSNVFKSAHEALSPTSSIRKVYCSSIHRKPGFNRCFRDHFQCYLMHGHYSGFYPKEGDLEEVCKPYFEVYHKYDASIDYQYSSLASPHHFGLFKIRWSIGKMLLGVLLFIVNPFAITTWLYYGCRTWMWQFGGLQVVEESKRPTKTFWYFYEATK